MTTADTTRLAIVEETGTPPTIPATPAWQIARFTGEGVAFQPTTVNSGELDPSGQVKDSILTGGTTSGAVNYEVSRNDFLEMLLEGVFRNDWGVGLIDLDPGPGVPVDADDLIPGLILKPYALEKRFQVLDAPLTYTYHRFSPTGVDTMSVSIAPGQPITGSANFSGGVQSLDDAEIAGSTYLDGGDNPIMTAPLVETLTIDTGTVTGRCLSAFVMNFASNLRAVECIGTLGPREILLGKFTVTMTGTIYYTDDTLVQKFLDQETFPVLVKLTDSLGNAYEFDFPKVKATQAPVVAGGTGQDVVIALALQAIYDSAKGYTVRVTRMSGAPGVTSVVPSTQDSNFGSFLLTVNGSGFVSGDVIVVDGIDQTTTFVSGTSLTCMYSPTPATADTLPVQVRSGAVISDPATAPILTLTNL